MDPKYFYNTIMPAKQGEDYEYTRWGSTPLLAAQRWMMERVLDRAVAPLLRGKMRVLEIGPGVATWTKKCLEIEPRATYTLIDISREMLGRAARALNGNKGIQYVEADILAYAPEQTFDFIFSSRAIEYVSDKEKLVAKLASLLDSGGEGVLITKMPKPFFDMLRGRAGRTFHSGQINPQKLSMVLQSAGLKVSSVRLATATVPLFQSAWLNKLAFTAFSRIPLFFPLTLFAESYLVSFKKL